MQYLNQKLNNLIYNTTGQIKVRDQAGLETLLRLNSGKKLKSLKSLFESIKRCQVDFYYQILPKIIKYSIEYNSLENFNIRNINSIQIRCLLANAFLLNIPKLDFSEVFEKYSELSVQRILCQINYFDRIEYCDESQIRVDRFMLNEESVPNYLKINIALNTESIHIHNESMESTKSDCFVDFANKDIHISKISPSFTQEEILFSCCPELCITIITEETLKDNEIILINGVRRFNLYTGYLGTFKYMGSDNLRPESVLIMDACESNQYNRENILRDCNKAYLGFMMVKHEYKSQNKEKISIATGHWGCGMFGGNIYLKYCQQLIASTLCDTYLDYSTFGNKKVQDKLEKLGLLIKNKKITVTGLFQILINYNPKYKFDDYIFKALS